MMATEATPEILATSSIQPDNELNTTETKSQDVTSEQDQPLVNGNAERDEPKPDADHSDAVNISAEVSVSGGSDTEASKAETSKAAGDEKGHVRTASTVKKFASFKPVSVNKTFLAAKSTTAATPSKLGDKGAAGTTTTQTGPSITATARPRLVAKTGSGLRDSTPRTASAANGGKPGAAPDANAVWNKNRPAPPPEPKRFTDEELKQQYGIHLATRLQRDDPGHKEKNWADIDDDDEDWAPEAIEWNDGTKITLPQVDDVPPPAPEPAPIPIVKDTKTSEAAKPKSPAPIQPSASPTVKPTGFGSGRAGLVLKGAAEKPTLVAKPPGPPTPVKSPWAPLPPVEKVAPIVTEPPQQAQQQHSRFSQRDPHGFHGMPPPPAKEIAADDFSRSWREGSNTSRELYNSQSGRYEPVNDNRRGSMRNDARSHQPAVLQRPMDKDGPAEPSAAFQTHRASGHQDAGYGRRRTSSNVSGGSGNFVRRMSRGHEMPPPHELLNIRRGSLAAVSDAPSSPRNFSPSGQPHSAQRGYQAQSWQSRASPVMSHPSPHSVHGQPIPPADIQVQPPTAPIAPVDVLEEQSKIMRLTREQAIKRRQEEEAKEEAERRERIRIKLEAMGPPPESKKKKDTPKEEKSIPTQIQAREGTDSIDAQSKPAAVNASDPTSQAIGTVDGVASKPDSVDVKPTDKSSPLGENRTTDAHQEHVPSPAKQVSQDGRQSQSWQGNSSSTPDRYKTWAAPAQQSTSRNVWGPPTNDRTLGNGTFNPELSRLPDMHQTPHPAPIGPPNSSRASASYQGREPYGSRPAPIGPPTRQNASRLDRDAQMAQNAAAVAASGWGNWQQTIAQSDAAMARERELELARQRENREKGISSEVPVIKETWRKISMNEDGTRGKPRDNVPVVHDTKKTWQGNGESSVQDTTGRTVLDDNDARSRQSSGPVSQQPFNDAWRPNNANPTTQGRPSRFFPPNGHQDVRLEEQVVHIERPVSPSPPPPTMQGHPAYDGDIAHPHVSLPRPAPVVKLPPPTVLAPIGPPKPTSFAAAVQAPAVPLVNHNAGYQRQDTHTRASNFQDVRRQEHTAGGWQDRINHLIGRKNSPPKSHALAVDSSSKNALELSHQQVGATVSLPSRSAAGSIAEDASYESKPAAEECFEEQEMGSLPVVKVPNSAPALAWNIYAPQPKTLPRKFQVSQVTSSESIHFPQQITNNSAAINIKMPNHLDNAKTVTMPVARQRSNPRRGGSRGGARQSAQRGGRGRDPSSGFPSPSLETSSVASTPNSSGRGRGRGYGSNWSSNRHVSTPVHT